jgi:hypothetical protein
MLASLLLSLAPLSLFSATAWADAATRPTDGTTVLVVDADSGAPIPGARVVADDADVGRTNTAGLLLVLGAPIELVIEAPGYDLLLVGAADLAAPIRLTRTLAPELIEVEGRAPTVASGEVRLDRAELQQLPGTGGDPIAALDMLGGVTQGAGGPLGYVGVTVRGSSPQDAKVLVDGFEVPLLYHAGGLRAVLPTGALASMQYLPGGFGVELGGATSGVVSLTTRPGGERRTAEVELGALDASALAGGPVGDGTLLLAGRRSVIDALLPSLLPGDLTLVQVPAYSDAQLRYDRALGERWHASLAALGATDGFELYLDDERDPDQRITFGSSFARATAQLAWVHAGRSVTIAGSGMDASIDSRQGRDYFTIYSERHAGARVEYAHTRAALGLHALTTRAGVSVDAHRYGYDLYTPNSFDEGQVHSSDQSEESEMLIGAGVQWKRRAAAWAALAADLTPRLRATAGARLDGYLDLDVEQLALQPRGELRWQAGGRTVVRASAGAYRRAPDYQDELLATGIGPERATQLVVGVEHELVDGVVVTGTTYATQRSRLLTRPGGGPYQQVGRGETYGAELGVSVRRGAWLVLGSYARARSTRVDEPGAAARLFDYDQPHDANLAATWQRGRWQLGGRARYGSGLPYTPVTGAVYASDRDRYVPSYGGLNSARVAAHAQLDLRIDYRWRWAALHMTAFLDVQNVTMNAPEVGIGYAYDYSRQEVSTGMPIVPSVGLRGAY